MEKVLYKNFKNKNLAFTLCRYNPRSNEFEKGLRYRLCVAYEELKEGVQTYCTGYLFSTVGEAKRWLNENYYLFL